MYPLLLEARQMRTLMLNFRAFANHPTPTPNTRHAGLRADTSDLGIHYKAEAVVPGLHPADNDRIQLMDSDRDPRGLKPRRLSPE